MKELFDLFLTFCRIGGLTFGGGYAMMPMLQRECVEKKGWVTKPNGGMGLLVTNPSTKNYEASSTCNMNDKVQWQSIPYHGGSVTYTFNKSYRDFI